jgi:hypothetical protein
MKRINKGEGKIMAGNGLSHIIPIFETFEVNT